MRERAANRAAIACLAMSDMIECCMHQRQAARDEVGEFKLALARHGANAQDISPLFNARQFADTRQIDKMIGLDEAKIHHGDERLSAGKNFGILQRGDKVERLREACRAVIFERGWFHSVNT